MLRYLSPDAALQPGGRAPSPCVLLPEILPSFQLDRAPAIPLVPEGIRLELQLPATSMQLSTSGAMACPLESRPVHRPTELRLMPLAGTSCTRPPCASVAPSRPSPSMTAPAALDPPRRHRPSPDPRACTRLSTGTLAASALLALLCAAPTPGQANPLEQGFMALPLEERISIQTELERYQLFTGVANGEWTPCTERALLRGAEEVMRRSNLYFHLRINRPSEVRTYLSNLQTGYYASFFARETESGGWSFLDALIRS